ncbi:hypothetical protein [Vibrio olivae]|uniref:Phage protein n=1 Tax=Vibrio olivae TaxID=1243002 RepID=A0ABV5HV09_9VIBR
MNPLKRRFLHLSELTDKTYLTQGDVFDAVNNHLMALCAVTQGQNFGGYISRSERVVVSIFDYGGVVRLSMPMSKRFTVSLETHTCEDILILEPDRVYRWRSVNQAFNGVQEASFSYKNASFKQPTGPFLASTEISTDLTVNSVLGKYAGMLSRLIPNEKTEQIANQYPDTGGQRLKIKPLSVKPEQLRIDIDDLIGVFGAESIKVSGYGSVIESTSSAMSTVNPTVGSTVKSTESMHLSSVNALPNAPLDSVSQCTDVRLGSVTQPLLTHPIALIAYRILQRNAQTRADKVWAMLRQDVNQHDFNRHYDVDLVVESITQDSVTWFGRGDSENTMSYDSFRKNVLVDVRRLVKAEQAENLTSS